MLFLTFSAQSVKTVILLLFNAGPLDVTWAQASPDVQVIIECFISGQGTGDALARMFTMQGEGSVPAGRLPMTWPRSLDQVRNNMTACTHLYKSNLVKTSLV